MTSALTRALWLGMVTSCVALSAWGQMAADRPGFTDPAAVLPHGVVHTEFGFAAQWERLPGERHLHLMMGSPTVRLGLGGGTELRFLSDGIDRFRLSGSGRERAFFGHADYAVGVKQRIRTESRLLPALTVVPTLSMPVGHRDFTSSTFDPTVKIAWEKALAGGFSLGGNVGWSSFKEDGFRHNRLGQTLALQREIASGISAYGEVMRAAAKGFDSVYIYNGGISQALTKNIAVDIEAGRIHDPSSPGWFVGFGIAIRNVLPAAFLR